MSLLSRKPGYGKDRQRKDWKPILRSNSAWRGKGRRRLSSKRWSGLLWVVFMKHSLLQNLENPLFSRPSLGHWGIGS